MFGGDRYMFVQALTDLLGEVPTGYDGFFYVFAALVLLWLLMQTFSILWTVVSWIGGRR